MKLLTCVLLVTGTALGVISNLPAADTDAARATIDPGGGINPLILTVDMKKIFETHPRTIEETKRIDELRNRSKNDETDELRERVSQLSREIVKLDDSLRSGELDGERLEQIRKLRNEKAAELKSLDEEMRDRGATRERELQEKSMQIRAQILEDIMKAVAAAPALSGASILVDKSGGSTNGVPVLVYSNPSLDRTGAVQKQTGVPGAIAENEDSGAGKPLSIAVVDMKRVFEGFYKTKEAEQTVNGKRGAAKKEVEEFMQKVSRASEDLKKLDQQLAEPGLSAAVRKTRTAERETKAAALEARNRESRELGASREKQVQDEAVALRNGIVDAISGVIVEGVRANGHVDLVFDSSGPSLNAVLILQRAEGVPDWTDAVVAALNSSQAGAKQTPIRSDIGAASTTGLRFAVIDLKRTFVTIPATKEAEKVVNEAREKVKAEATSDAEREAKSKELQALSLKLRTKVVEKITGAIAEKAKAAGCHVLLDVSGMTLNGVPVVVIHRGLPDLTNEVITTLGGAAP